MRVVVLVKATPASEAEVLPSTDLLAEMGRFNEELAQAGMLLAGEGLRATAHGARVRFSAERTEVILGPFGPAEAQVSGFWLWQVDTFDAAIEWVRRIPQPDELPMEFEIRPVFEAEDFGPNFTPELRDREERLRRSSSKV
jgi:hypothetical protein